MQAVLRRRLEMAARTRDFLRANRTEVAGEVTALARLEELVDRAEALVAQQAGGVVGSRSATVHRLELRRAIQTKFLKYLAAVGRVAAKENAELVVELQPPSMNASHQAFLTASRLMLENATAQKDMLVGKGMSVTLLDDLGAALVEFEKTLEATRAGRRDHVGASADLEAVAVEIGDQVRLLDGVVRYRFGENPELVAAWESARNVLGPFRSKAEPQAGETQTPTEAGPDVVKPAA